MTKYLLIGKDTSSSYSPFIHNWMYKNYDLKSHYVTKNIKSSDALNSWINGSLNVDIAGFNITNPYKESIIHHLNDFDNISNIIGSVNCVKINKSNMIGYNTDYYGFSKLLDINNINLNNHTNLVIGYGGSSKTILHYLNNIDSDTYILVRDIKDEYKKLQYRFLDIRTFNNHNFDNFNIINCTPIDFINSNSELFSSSKLKIINWIDLLYENTTTSASKKLCAKGNINYVNGLDMLIYQAISSIDIWFEKNYVQTLDLQRLKTDLMKGKYVK